jgi:glucose/arabinose dehydrogenase
MFRSFLRKGIGGLLVLSFSTAPWSALPTGFHQKVIFDKADMVSSCVLPDGRIIAVEKSGKLTVIDQKTGTKKVAIDLTSKTWNRYEGGMMCVVADLDFLHNGYLYVQYTKLGAVGGADHDWVDRYKMTGDVIDPNSAFKILDEGDKGPNYHHGGGMAISPKDGMLYICVGSRRNSSTNQNQPEKAVDPKTVLGKICRVKVPSGEIPADNPYFSTNTGDARAVYYIDVRNPFTIAVHPTTGKIWWTDVRDGSADDYKDEGKAPGTDYGFSTGKNGGGLFQAGKIGFGGGAMVGSMWYTGSNFPAEYKDKYFFGQVRSGGANASMLKYTDEAHTTFTSFGPFNVGNSGYFPIDVKMDAGGAIYVSTRYQTEDAHATAGQIIKVWYGDTEPDPAVTPTWVEHRAREIASQHMSWTNLSKGGLSIEMLQEGNQTVELSTLDGKTLATRTLSGKGKLELPGQSKGLHILTWTSGARKAAVKVML